MAIGCLILAGDSQSVENSEGITCKSLLQLGGREMILRVLDAFHASASVDRCVVIGPEALRDKLCGRAEWLKASGDMFDNVVTGLAGFKDEEYALIATSDIPYLTARAVDDFVARAMQTGADFVYPIVERAVCEAAFPAAKRTYVSMQEGSFTGGNIVFTRPGALLLCEELARKLIAMRKTPVRTARELGMGMLLRLLLGRLSIREVEDWIRGNIGIEARALVSPYAEIGNDIDKEADLREARRALSV